MKSLMVSLLAYSTAGTGALLGLWLAARWPSPRRSQVLAFGAGIAAVVALGAFVI